MFKTNTSFKALRQVGVAALTLAALSGCSTIADWFAEEEEIEIRRLKPLNAQFQPSVVWDTDIGKGVSKYYSNLRPVYGYEKLYVADRHGKVKALDPQTGKPIWQQDFAIFRDEGYLSSISNLWKSGESAKISGLVLGYDKLFVGTENGVVIALDAQSGEPVWETAVKGEILAAGSIDNGTLVLNTGSGTMFALDTDSGEQLWQHESDVPPLSLRGISSPVASNGGAIVGTASGKLQVNILDSGLPAWEATIGTPTGATELERIVDVDTTPLVYAGMVYVVSYNGTLAAVELRSGRVVWKREYGSFRNVTMDGNRLFVTDVNSNVYGLDRRNGVELWSQGGLKGRVLTAPQPFGDYIVAGDKYGFLHLFTQENGDIVARLEVGSDDEDESIYVSPLVVDDKLIVVTRDGEVNAITMPNQ